MSIVRDPQELLTRWESAAALPSAARITALVPSDSEWPGDPLDLPLAITAERATRTFRDQFGDAVPGLMVCDECGEQLDVAVSLDALPGAPEQRHAAVSVDGQTWHVRCPTARDLLAVSAEPEPVLALIARCVQDADGRPTDPERLPVEAMAAVDAAAEELAGGAAVVLRTACPGCGAELATSVDVGDLLWQRTCLAVPELLREVAVLAGAFGWREADILALPAARRRAYLQLAEGAT